MKLQLISFFFNEKYLHISSASGIVYNIGHNLRLLQNRQPGQPNPRCSKLTRLMSLQKLFWNLFEESCNWCNWKFGFLQNFLLPAVHCTSCTCTVKLQCFFSYHSLEKLQIQLLVGANEENAVLCFSCFPCWHFSDVTSHIGEETGPQGFSLNCGKT